MRHIKVMILHHFEIKPLRIPCSDMQSMFSNMMLFIGINSRY